MHATVIAIFIVSVILTVGFAISILRDLLTPEPIFVLAPVRDVTTTATVSDSSPSKS